MSAFSTTHWIIAIGIIAVVVYGIYRAGKETRKGPPRE